MAKRLKCSRCGKGGFRKFYEIGLHARAEHPEMACPVCSQKFHNRFRYAGHMKRHAVKDPAPPSRTMTASQARGALEALLAYDLKLQERLEATQRQWKALEDAVNGARKA